MKIFIRILFFHFYNFEKTECTHNIVLKFVNEQAKEKEFKAQVISMLENIRAEQKNTAAKFEEINRKFETFEKSQEQKLGILATEIRNLDGKFPMVAKSIVAENEKMIERTIERANERSDKLEAKINEVHRDLKACKQLLAKLERADKSSSSKKRV